MNLKSLKKGNCYIKIDKQYTIYFKLDYIIENKKIFEIKVITKASCDKIYLENNIIKVKIREIPENGKANKAIIELFSKTFKIPKKNIEIIKGQTSSNKTITFYI